MLSNSYHYVQPADETEQTYLKSLIHKDFERCYPDETLEDVRHQAPFSGEDKGLFAIGCRSRRFARQPVVSRHRLPTPHDRAFRAPDHAAGRTPKSFGFSIRSASVYLSRTALKASSPSCRMPRNRQLRVIMH